MSPRRFLRDRTGAAAVELALLTPLFFVTLLSLFDLGLLAWRWNQAVEAARAGARLAAVSNPVSSDLASMTGLETGVEPGDPTGAYERVCSGAACSGGVYDAAAMSRLYYGPGGAVCDDSTPRNAAGLCDLLPRLTTDKITVSYRSSGVDTAGVVGALRPLVSVRIAGVPSRMVLIDRLFPGFFAALPATEVTVLAEDMRSSA